LIVNAFTVAWFLAVDLRDGPIYLTLAATAFVVTARLEPQRWKVSGYIAATIVGVGLVLAVNANSAPLAQLVPLMFVMVAGGALGALVRIRSIASRDRTRAAATEERLRMAQDLHDGVGHGLAVIAMQAGVGLHVLEKDPTAVREALEAIRDTARESLDSLRAELEQLAGESTVRPHRGLADLDALVDRVRAAGLAVTVTGEVGSVDGDRDAASYAVIQEALTNVLRHAQATQVSVALGPRFVRVTDNGRGGAVQDEGMGLRGMRERVQALGGTLSAGPRADSGFEVRAEFPA
jgi:signal transduction histidine kinase